MYCCLAPDWFPGWSRKYGREPSSRTPTEDCVELRQSFPGLVNVEPNDIVSDDVPTKVVKNQLYWNDQECRQENWFVCSKRITNPSTRKTILQPKLQNIQGVQISFGHEKQRKKYDLFYLKSHAKSQFPRSNFLDLYEKQFSRSNPILSRIQIQTIWPRKLKFCMRQRGRIHSIFDFWNIVQNLLGHTVLFPDFSCP